MIGVARITMYKLVAAAHWRGLLRTVLVVGVSSNAVRKTSFGVVGDRPTARPSRGKLFRAELKTCIRLLAIGSPFANQNPQGSEQRHQSISVTARVSRGLTLLALDSLAMSRVDSIRPDEAQKHQNRQNSEEQKCDHESRPSSTL
jgi:hypothetical protein